MKVRVTYRMETYIEADTIAEARDKFEESPMNEYGLWSDFVELVSVEDAETHKDLLNEWDNAFDGE